MALRQDAFEHNKPNPFNGDFSLDELYALLTLALFSPEPLSPEASQAIMKLAEYLRTERDLPLSPDEIALKLQRSSND